MKDLPDSPIGFRCGIVAVVGRPNVGKSTLINALVENDILATSAHPHTTRRQIRAIDSTERYQAIYVDTPGIHKPSSVLSERMNDFAYDALSGSEVVIAVFDGSKNIGPGDRFVCDAIRDIENLIVVLNKCDVENHKERVASRALEISQLVVNAKHFFMLSAFTKKNVHLLKKEIIAALDESPALFDKQLSHDMSDEQLISELLRESLLHQLRDELPQSLGVVVRENMESQGAMREFEARIVVAKKSHKPIVISKSGSLLKNAGTRARKRAEILLESPIVLTTHVEVDENWQGRSDRLDDFFS